MTSLEEIGEPILGSGFEVNVQSPGTGISDRTVTRRYKIRLLDVPNYGANLLSPFLYDVEYPQAVIVDQTYRPNPGDKADGELIRVFSELPSSWDEPDDRVVTFPGVAQSSLYGPRDFLWRSSQASLRTSVRIHHDYFITADQLSIPRYDKFVVINPFGLQTTVITDFTNPTADEWVSKVAGLGEIVVDCQVKRWKGAIFDRATTFAVAQ